MKAPLFLKRLLLVAAEETERDEGGGKAERGAYLCRPLSWPSLVFIIEFDKSLLASLTLQTSINIGNHCG